MCHETPYGCSAEEVTNGQPAQAGHELYHTITRVAAREEYSQSMIAVGTALAGNASEKRH